MDFETHINSYRNDMNRKVLSGDNLASGHYNQDEHRQLEYLKARGLQSEHLLLDIGCGIGRAAVQQVAHYLQPGHFYGVDMSEAAIVQIRRTIHDGKFAVTDGWFPFDWFRGIRFDFIWSASVMQHMTPPQVAQCLQNVALVMKPETVFLFTFRDTGKWQRLWLPDFTPLEFFRAAAPSRRIEEHDDYAPAEDGPVRTKVYSVEL